MNNYHHHDCQHYGNNNYQQHINSSALNCNHVHYQQHTQVAQHYNTHHLNKPLHNRQKQ